MRIKRLSQVRTTFSMDAGAFGAQPVKLMPLPSTPVACRNSRTSRWMAYDTKRFGIKPLKGTTMTLQGRAYTSPIWCTPGK